eukprot:TRINITY_DN54966_c0_g1_i1.p1 TRINITY_DN54966_c0_g1~~TRINITY_DN54966_c0_g1_i1.p1  ORF type:complete len:281 (-),score=26.46 TRINITY_DN54966_c0_g1_i1:398-1240(-)
MIYEALLTSAKALAISHVALVGGSAAFIAFPSPFKRLKQPTGTPLDDGIEFESLKLADGCPAWLTCPRSGGQSAICLCHGRSRNKAWLRPLIRALARDHAVLAFDFKGHGENPYGSTTLGVREASTVDMALHLLQERGYERVLLYGCSMGGAAAILSQSRSPNPCVRGLVTDGTFAVFSEVIENRGACFPAYMRNGALSLAGLLAGYDPWGVRPIDHVSRLSVPTRFLHGDVDALVPPDAAARMASKSLQAKAQYYKGGHDEPHNHAVHVAVREFAAEVL